MLSKLLGVGHESLSIFLYKTLYHIKILTLFYYFSLVVKVLFINEQSNSNAIRFYV